jgi:hypothetical protein
MSCQYSGFFCSPALESEQRNSSTHIGICTCIGQKIYELSTLWFLLARAWFEADAKSPTDIEICAGAGQKCQKISSAIIGKPAARGREFAGVWRGPSACLYCMSW